MQPAGPAQEGHSPEALPIPVSGRVPTEDRRRFGLHREVHFTTDEVAELAFKEF
jgi:hypothetical protein